MMSRASSKTSTSCPVCLATVKAPLGVVEKHELEFPGEKRLRRVWCPMSGQAQFEWDEPATRDAVQNRSCGICETCGKQRATDMHHRIPRSVGGGWHPSNIVHVCRGCHDWFEQSAHREEAGQRGFLLHSSVDPATVPIRRFNGIATLLSDNVTPPRPAGKKKRAVG